jgi:hypothetical protein
VDEMNSTYSGFQISKPQLASLGVGCGVWGVVNAHENGCNDHDDQQFAAVYRWMAGTLEAAIQRNGEFFTS